MSHLIALELDAAEARVASASLRGGHVTLERILAVSLPAGEEAGAAARGEVLAAALKEHGIARGETLGLIGRGSVELRQLTLPPAPDDELPEMVRNLAYREFNEAEEDWPLDFAPIDIGTDGPRGVLATAADPARVAEMQRVCEAAGLKLKRILLRPLETAGLLAASLPADAEGLRLLVDVQGDEVDLSVLRGRRAALLRTARLPGDLLHDEAHVPALLGELRRTLVVAQNQLSGRPIESIVFIGSPEHLAALAEHVAEKLKIATEVLDPVARVKPSREWNRAPEDLQQRSAPFVGALTSEAQNAAHAVDFLNPRRSPEPPSRRNYYAMAGVAVVVLALAWFGYSRLSRYQIENDVNRLTQQAKSEGAKAKKAAQLESNVAEIQKWVVPRAVWLDELALLAERLPPAREVMIERLTLSAGQRSGPAKSDGQIQIEGRAASASAIDNLTSQLSDERHIVVEPTRAYDADVKPYQWRFSASISILPASVTNAASPDADDDSTKKASPSRAPSGEVAAGTSNKAAPSADGKQVGVPVSAKVAPPVGGTPKAAADGKPAAELRDTASESAADKDGEAPATAATIAGPAVPSQENSKDGGRSSDSPGPSGGDTQGSAGERSDERGSSGDRSGDRDSSKKGFFRGRPRRP